MSKFLSKMKVDMELKGLSPRTIPVYLKGVRLISEFHNTNPEELTYDHVREFLHHAIIVRKLSRSYINTNYSAIKFFFETTLGRDWNMKDIPRVKQPSKLPVTLSPDEIKLLLNSVTNLKHKTMITIAYSAGLRVGEIVNLRISDIDSKSMRIRIRKGKGLKERYSILSQNCLDMLRVYYKQYRPTDYLFTNPRTGLPLHQRTIQQVFKDKRNALKLPADVTVHSLRHSFATHLLLAGTNIAMIQKLLGHANISTTSKYLHLTNQDITKVISPFDALGDLDD